MLFRRKRREMPLLNTTSTADISFMLLIFFLVTTSMDHDKGLERLLPPQTPPEELLQETSMSARNVMKIRIESDNTVLVDGEKTLPNQLRGRVMTFVDNPENSPSLPEKQVMAIPLLGNCAVATNHIIQVNAAREASYDTYFFVQNEVVAAYNQLRDRRARQKFGLAFEACSPEQKEALRKCYPQRVSEVYNNAEEGGRP